MKRKPRPARDATRSGQRGRLAALLAQARQGVMRLTWRGRDHRTVGSVGDRDGLGLQCRIRLHGARRTQAGYTAQLGRAFFFKQFLTARAFFAGSRSGGFDHAGTRHVLPDLPQRGQQRQQEQRAQGHRTQRMGALCGDGQVRMVRCLLH